jgi:F0F1-type ATP synthase assembly protein I
MKYNKNVYRSLVMITQFGLNMLVPIFICTFLGIFLDNKLNTSFLTILFFFIGALAGFRNIFLFARKIYEDKEKADEKTKRNQ